MIEIGVTNIVGTYRSDTKYDPDDSNIKNAKIGETPYCQDPKLPCIEVKLEVSNWWAQPSGSTLTPGVNTLNKQLFGNEKDADNYPDGFVLTDGSFTPADALVHVALLRFTMGRGFAGPCLLRRLSVPDELRVQWKHQGRMAHWRRIFGQSVQHPATTCAPNHCKEGLDRCSIALAGFALTPVPSTPTDLQYLPWNDYLIRWFNRALTSFPDQVTDAERERHFAWITKTVGWDDFVYPQALHNPFQGAFTAHGEDRRLRHYLRRK